MKSKALAIGSVFVLCMTVLAGVCTMTDDSEADDAKSYSWRVGTAVNESWDSLSFNPDRYTGSVPGVTVSLDYDDMADVGIVEFTGTPTTAGTYTVTVTYTGEQTGTVKMYTPKVGTTSYRVISVGTSDPADMTGTAGVYTCGGVSLPSGELHAIYFEMYSEGSEDPVDSSGTVNISANVSHGDVVKHALKWNLYATGLTVLVFFLRHRRKTRVPTSSL